MVFRLPSHLETLVPPPFDQRVQPPPWRGSFFVSGMRASDRNSSHQISVTAVETDGEKAQQWPDTFNVRVLHEQPVLREFEMWLRTYMPPLPLCTFMPKRLRDSDQHTLNKSNFHSLSTHLYSSQTVAVASWAPNSFPGGGIIIYPAHNSSAVLVGALFFDMPFPDFITGTSSPMSPITPMAMQPSRHAQYPQQRIITTPYVPSPYRHAPSLSPHRSDPNSPVEQPIAAHRQDPYRYIIPRSGQAAYGNQPTSSTTADPNWGTVKAEDDSPYSAFPPSHHNPPYP
ncbi:unnamed protein product [Cyclocybe aegerita]|uniref:Uncharacterized protein n=1 Tax=Cyclocybe aegerita TaxID=1973307 RepID=A0A8S0WA28_CYCAE|nr:unnamed protein product [Cyclocybe aegerita]